MAKKIMIQGTMSNSGKSFLAAALCRILKQDGYSVAPFKSQNMALNSYITKEGLEIGRAQAMQAEAAGIAPTVDMNPILLKPTSQMGSQVIVNGEVFGNLRAMDYYKRKTEFIPAVQEAFARLENKFDAIVLEGAGSPAEINLRDNDIVNMGMAKIADAPVLLVGDIDRGGVFASLYGTVNLLEPEERARIKGLVINKFRGDVKILEPGLRMIEEKLHIPVVGVIPMEQIDLDDEDSLSDRLVRTEVQEGLDVAVIRLPHISNFTDFNALEHYDGVSLRYVDRVAQLRRPDLILLPGTKNTMEDLKWLRESGLETMICRLVEEQKIPLIGICGGYQMLGEQLLDPDGVEGEPGSTMRGMGLLKTETIFAKQKTRTQTEGSILAAAGAYDQVTGQKVKGYEIHMGETFPTETELKKNEALQEKSKDCVKTADSTEGGNSVHTAGQAENGQQAENAILTDHSITPAIRLADGRMDGFVRADGLVLGSYLHGLFDNLTFTGSILTKLAEKKGISLTATEKSMEEYKESQYDKLADLVRKSLDMEAVYRIMEEYESPIENAKHETIRVTRGSGV